MAARDKLGVILRSTCFYYAILFENTIAIRGIKNPRNPAVQKPFDRLIIVMNSRSILAR